MRQELHTSEFGVLSPFVLVHADGTGQEYDGDGLGQIQSFLTFISRVSTGNDFTSASVDSTASKGSIAWLR